ncbi:hypothetical protein B0H13DRAFT_1890045 [Mycena leptocephala]|nr:hypothetical protein B0H13DRAFT_1890045 [Mycena leptocephala]
MSSFGDHVKEELKEQTEGVRGVFVPAGRSCARMEGDGLGVQARQHETEPVRGEGLTEAEVQLQFSKEEDADIASGIPSLHDISPSAFIMAACLCSGQIEKAQTTEMKIDMGAMCTKLNCGIARFRRVQQTYMLAAVQTLGAMALPSTTLAEDVPLMLPSTLTDAEQAQVLTYKKNQVHHQGANTRSRTTVARNESKVRLHSEKYQTAWEAIHKLNGGNETMKGKATHGAGGEVGEELRAYDLQLAGEDDGMDCDNEGEVCRGSENQCLVSWIWTLAGMEGSDAALGEGLRVEWVKSFARMRRWREKLQLVSEEFLHVSMSFDYKAAKWERHAGAIRVGVIPHAEAEGTVAYAKHHVEIYCNLKARGEKMWTAERLAWGKRRARHILVVVGEMEAEARLERDESARAMQGLNAGRGVGEEEDEQGLPRAKRRTSWAGRDTIE